MIPEWMKKDPQILKAIEAMNDVRTRAILEGWGRQYLTFALSLCLEIDRIVAEESGNREIWARYNALAVEEARREAKDEAIQR